MALIIQATIHFNVPEDGEWEIPAMTAFVMGWLKHNNTAEIDFHTGGICFCEFSPRDDYRFEFTFTIRNYETFSKMCDDLKSFMETEIECTGDYIFIEC